MTSPSQPEIDALIACGAPPPDAVRRLSGHLDSRLNWPALIELADSLRMLPLFARVLSQCPLGTVPPAILAEIRSRVVAKAMRSLAMAGELSRLLRILETAGMTPIAFKGPTLAHAAYGDIALRDSGDLDIFVPHSQIAKALKILAAEGYGKKSPGSNVDLSGDIEITLQPQHLPWELDLHWQFSPRYFPAFDAARAAERSIVVQSNGLTARTLCPEDLLLYLCLHAARECWPLKCVFDIAALVRQGNMDWADLMSEAARQNCWRMVAVGLQLAAGLFQTSLPPHVWSRVQQDKSAAAVAAHLVSRLRRCEQISEDTLSGALLHLRMVTGRSDRLRYVWHRAVDPKQTDVNFVRLPEVMSAAYYVVRPLRVAAAALFRIPQGGRFGGSSAEPLH